MQSDHLHKVQLYFTARFNNTRFALICDQWTGDLDNFAALYHFREEIWIEIEKFTWLNYIIYNEARGC